MIDVSVAMATYQGDRYLAQQLASIVAQSVLPSECVIADDGSTDRTLDIVRDFEGRAPFPVVLLKGGDEQFGATQNLARALARTTGEVVLFADQDDVWESTKVEVIREAFGRPEVLAVFTDAAVIDSMGASTGRTLWQATDVKRAAIREDLVGVLMRCNPASGATMGVRRSLIDVALPIPPDVIHDYWFALHAAFRGGLGAVEDITIRYRTHTENLVGPNVGSRLGRVRQRRRRTMSWTERDVFEEFWARVERDHLGTAEQRSLLERKVALLRLRAELPSRRYRRLVPCLTALARGDYHRFARGFDSLALDLLGPSTG